MAATKNQSPSKKVKLHRIEYDYSDAPTLLAFSKDPTRIRGVMGPFGCIAGDTLIVTECGLLPISDIDRPMRVLSWNEKSDQFELSLSSGSYPKGTDYLYRVVTAQGEFVAAGFHRVLDGRQTYRRVDSLGVGESLCVSSHPQTIADSAPLAWHGGEPRWIQKLAGLMDDYAKSARQYGQQLLQAQDSALSTAQLSAGVPVLFLPSDQVEADHEDDYRGPIQAHNHPSQCSDPIQTDDSCPLSAPLEVNGQDRTSSQPSEHTLTTSQQVRRSLLMNGCRQIIRLFSACYRSLVCSITERPILSITKLPDKQTYWDLQVLDTHNYVTADGSIHHNSGKSSACVLQIILDAAAQEPGDDGIRRTRWAVVRNTYRQLEDTTIKTFFEWIPPTYCGKYNKAKHTYLITCFKDIEIEVLFRALDRPEHVSNLLSLELTSAWVNEAREVPWALIKALRSRTNRYPSRRNGGPGSTKPDLIMDTNPPSPRSWWYTLFEVTKPKNAILYKQPGGLDKKAENTSHLADTYYQDMGDLYDGDELKVYRDGEYGFIKSGKPVFPTYRDNLHSRVGLTPIPGIPLLRGWDFGLTPACIVAQVSPGGQLRLIREYVTKRAGLDTFSDELIKDMKVRYRGYDFEDYGDESGVKGMDTDDTSCFDLLGAKGIDVQPITNVIRTRLESVTRGLNTLVDGEPALILDQEGCPTCREGFQGGYKYKKILSTGGDDMHQTKPLKNEYSHPHDCIQYLCVVVFGDFVAGLTTSKEIEDNMEDIRRGVRKSDPWDTVSYNDEQTDQDCDFDPFDT